MFKKMTRDRDMNNMVIAAGLYEKQQRLFQCSRMRGKNVVFIF